LDWFDTVTGIYETKVRQKTRPKVEKFLNAKKRVSKFATGPTNPLLLRTLERVQLQVIFASRPFFHHI